MYLQVSFRESISNPKYVDSDFAKFDRPLQLHLAFQALHEFEAKNNRLPKPRNEQDAEEIWQTTQQLNEKLGIKTELDEKLIKLFAYGAAGEVSPMVAVFGGLVAQEVLKVCL
jgi:ubiquitin-activating enzyme E1